MRNSARGIIIKDGKVLVMFRRRIENNEKREYYVVPGGGIEEGETPELAVVRELKEEMCVDSKILGYLGKGETKSGYAYYYACEIPDSQTPHLGGEELEKLSDANYYEPMFIEIKKIENLDLVGKEFISPALNREYIIFEKEWIKILQ